MAKNTWFRFYNSVVHDPKVQRLQGETFKAWVNMLCIASDNEGMLPSVPDLAFSLRLTEQETSELIDQLFSLGLLDAVEIEGGPMAYTPHNWGERQFKSDGMDPTAPDRMKRYRAKQRNDRNATVTVTPTRADTEQIQNRTEKIDAGASDDWPADFRDQFWAAYPNKVGKSAAINKLVLVRKAGIPWAVLVAGLDRYKRTKPPDRPWCNPLTWLNQGRWDDAPAEGGSAPSADFVPDWDDQVSRWLKGQTWSVRWYGAEPGQPGCRVPPEVLQRHGVLSEDRKIFAA